MIIVHDKEMEELIALASNFPIGKTLNVAHDGFSGTVQGYYVTREGKAGLVLQLTDAKVIHVYGVKWFREGKTP